MSSPYTVFSTYIVHGYTKKLRSVPREIETLISCFFGEYFRIVVAIDVGTRGTAAGYTISGGDKGHKDMFMSDHKIKSSLLMSHEGTPMDFGPPALFKFVCCLRIPSVPPSEIVFVDAHSDT